MFEITWKNKKSKMLKKKSHHELRNLPLNFTDECIKYPFLFSLLKSIDQSIGCHWGELAHKHNKNLEKRKKWNYCALLFFLQQRELRVRKRRWGEKKKKKERKLWLRVDNSYNVHRDTRGNKRERIVVSAARTVHACRETTIRVKIKRT